MKLHGSASAGTNDSVGNFSRKMTVVSSGSSILSTMTKLFRRALETPGGGKDDLAPARADVVRVERRAVMEFHAWRILNV